MQSKFLESDFFCTKRILLFGINRIQSFPTINYVKQVDSMYDDFLQTGIDQVYFISVCDFLLFDPMMSKLAPRTRSVQLIDPVEIKQLQTILGKKGNLRFLQEYWQFAAMLNKQNVEYYIDQPFRNKVSQDTMERIYSNIDPVKVLQSIQEKLNE